MCEHYPDVSVWAYKDSNLLGFGCWFGQLTMCAFFRLSKESVKHASLQASGSGYIPHRELDHLAHVWAASQSEEREPTSSLFVPVKAPERGGAALENFNVDCVLTWCPLRCTHHDHRGGEAAGVRGDAVKHGLPWPHRCTPLPHHASLLCNSHPTEVTEGQKAHLLQGLLIRKTEQDGNETRNRASTE